ncbi:26226_t:CDS:2, partial [Racocetra persica]
CTTMVCKKKFLKNGKFFWNDDNLDAVEDMIDDELLQEIMQESTLDESNGLRRR